MKVRVYTDYNPIRILRGVAGKDFTEPNDALAQKAGLVGNYELVEDIDVLSDRTNRDCWKVENGKIKEDSVKVQAKLDKEAAKVAKKNAVLSKLKITEQEFAELIKG